MDVSEKHRRIREERRTSASNVAFAEIMPSEDWYRSGNFRFILPVSDVISIYCRVGQLGVGQLAVPNVDFHLSARGYSHGSRPVHIALRLVTVPKDTHRRGGECKIVERDPYSGNLKVQCSMPDDQLARRTSDEPVKGHILDEWMFKDPEKPLDGLYVDTRTGEGNLGEGFGIKETFEWGKTLGPNLCSASLVGKDVYIVGEIWTKDGMTGTLVQNRTASFTRMLLYITGRLEAKADYK